MASGQERTLTVDPTGRGTAAPPFLSLKGIKKRFPGVVALAGVDLALRAGRVHALVGENGAGKSTLIKVMSGIVHPDEGRILLDGRQVNLRSPADALRRGINLVPQELSLVPGLSVAENIYLGHLPHQGIQVRKGELRRAARELLDRLGLDIDPGSALEHHSAAVQQLVMIARGIASRGRLFIFDEPTAALADPEIERLFVVLHELRAEGAALVYVSHRLAELQEVADDITVLRDGQVVDRVLARDTSEDALVRSMIGRPIERFFDTRAARDVEREVVLSAKGLTRRGAFENVSFSLHRGEVVGLAGLMGAGRTEVARAIFGLDRLDRGEIELHGTPVRIRSPKQAIAKGLALVPEERKAQGLVLNRSISDNIVLPHLWELSYGPFFREGHLRAYSRRAAEEVKVKAAGVTVPVGTLSGGNQQKVVLGRWLATEPQIYILDEPTRGIDIQVKTEIYRQIGRLAAEGAAVLVISSQLPELLGICDRILVMRSGHLVGDVEAAHATEESILQLAMMDEFLLPPKDAVALPPGPGPEVQGPITGASVSLPYSSSLPLDDGPVGDPGRTYVFGFSQALIDSSWAVAQRESFMLEAARHPNVEVRYHNTANDPARQIADLDGCIAQEVDALVVWPHSVGPLTPAVERAKQAGIPVIGMERSLATRSYDTWIWLDFAKATADLAAAVGKEVRGRGVVAEVPGSSGSSPQILRHDGFVRAIRERFPRIRVVTGQPTDWSRADGQRVALELLEAEPRIDAWYVHYSEIAFGVAEALEERGRSEPIYTIVDGKEAVAAVRDGRFRALAPWSPLHGDLAFRAAAYHVTGRAVPKDLFLAQAPLITRKNADEELRHSWGALAER